MFHLQDRQLHIMLLLVLIASGIFFFIFGVEDMPERTDGQAIQQLEDFSDGWIYPKNEDNQVVSFPLVLDAKSGDKFSFYHRVPEMQNESCYLVFQTKKQPVQVCVDGTVIYESSEINNKLNAYHVVKLLPEYNYSTLSFIYTREDNSTVEISPLLTGTKNQLYGQVVKDNLRNIIWCGMLIFLCIIMLVMYGMIKNTNYAKAPLLYGSIEGCLFGLFGIFQGNLIPLLTGWNYAVYIGQLCLIILIAMLHLLVLRCFTYKKKIISQIEMGNVVLLIYFISVLVLHFFDLISLDIIFNISKWFFAILVILYTAIMGFSVFDRNGVESKLIFYANIILLVGMLVQITMTVVGRDIDLNDIFLPIGVTIYIVFVLYVSLKRALFVKPKKADDVYNEEEMRSRIIEQINPNLFFASFHTLQNLIKAGSANSVKMIYYISVYFKSNLKAIEGQGITIPFSEELEHIMAYLQLQKTRNENLKFALECKVTDFQVPRHCIEPLVENAVKHGIGGKGNVGNIVVRTYLRAEGYAIQVIDDGAGFDKTSLKKHSNTSLLYLLDILEKACKAQTEIITHEGKGTVITIILPMLDNDLMEQS